MIQIDFIFIIWSKQPQKTYKTVALITTAVIGHMSILISSHLKTF